MTADSTPGGTKPTPDVLSTESLMSLTREDILGDAQVLPRRAGSAESATQMWPAAVAVVAMIILAAMAIELHHYPLIPFVAIGIICIRSWPQRWARTVWYVTLTVYALWLLIHTVPLWLPFFFALLAAYILSPLVAGIERGLKRLRVPWARTLAVVIFFIVSLGGIAVLDMMVIHNARDTIDKLVEGIQKRSVTGSIVNNIEQLKITVGMGKLDANQREKLTEWSDKTVSGVQEDLPRFGAENAQALLGHAGELFGWIAVLLFDVFIFLFATFYLLIDFPRLSAKVDSWFSPSRSIRLARLSEQIGKILRSYLQGHTAACVLMGMIYFFVLVLFGHPYAPLLGLLMGILSLIPFLGPVTAGVLSILLTLTVGIDPATAAGVNPGQAMLGVIVAYAVAHGLNDTVIYPLVAGRSVHISAVETLLVLFVVGHFFGILGMFFAVPLWAIVRKLVTWMNEEHIPGFEWLKLFRPYEVRHEKTLRLQRQEAQRTAAHERAEQEYTERKAAGASLSLSEASDRMIAASEAETLAATAEQLKQALEPLDDADLPASGMTAKVEPAPAPTPAPVADAAKADDAGDADDDAGDAGDDNGDNDDDGSKSSSDRPKKRGGKRRKKSND
ncbi:MAG: AI-2E family transporter [Planctomycetota bacterium]